jgi:iron-sulfur cluster assembly accessory protein
MTTTTPGTKTTFTITDTALTKIREVMAQQELAADERNLRLFVDGGGGCCGGGPSFGLAFDRAQEGDTQFSQGGMNVIVDPMSLPFCAGATVDFVDTPEMQGFKVSAPAMEKQQSGGGCGSGGCGSEGGGGGCGSGSGACATESEASHGHSHAAGEGHGHGHSHGAEAGHGHSHAKAGASAKKSGGGCCGGG